MDEQINQELYEGRAGRDVNFLANSITDDSLLRALLWENPCWFSFRMNSLALRFNNPVYSYIQQKLDLLRPDFVVLWSLYLAGSMTQTDVVRSIGFPKNTMSRAVNKMHARGMIGRKEDTEDQRRVTLHLRDKGREAVEQVMAAMLRHERVMLDCLSPAEKLNLSEILTKLVIASSEWPQSIEDDPNGGKSISQT